MPNPFPLARALFPQVPVRRGAAWTARFDQRLQALPVRTALVLPGGHALGAARDARVTLRLHGLRQLGLLLRGQVGQLAQAHVDGRFGIEGSMRDVMAVAGALVAGEADAPTAVPVDRPPLPPRAQSLLQRWSLALHEHRSRRQHRLQRDRQQIEFHYDVGNDFYALWLDPRRVYSCAYWAPGVQTLAQAQEAKLELICRKLMLRPGERFLDVGAGWGALLLWAAERHGVIAHGITLSQEQHAHVTQLIRQRGLQGRVTIALCDYRELPGDEPYDKIASVGMFEHVGRAQLPAYFATLLRLLKPGGLLMNHGITAGKVGYGQLGAGIGDFIERNIFPGGDLVHISTALADMAEAGLEPLDIENLRPHYARTLWDWSDALEAQLDRARQLVDDRTLRAYRLYLAGSAMGFERGWMLLHQVLASRPSGRIDDGPMRGAQSSYPYVRDHVYAAPLGSAAQ